MNNEQPSFNGPVCPIPLRHTGNIVMGHGSGGLMTQDLVETIFLSRFSQGMPSLANDFASTILPDEANLTGRLAVSTDSHIVSPLFFPGGDIGKLAVCGTVNDICMSGAVPLYLTAGFIIEEGLEIDILARVVDSMQNAAQEAHVNIISGDTKVVEKGKADRLFINTTGIGWIPPNRQIGGECARPGDKVLISGTMGDHGITVLSARGDLGLQTNIKSDVSPLNELIVKILAAAPHTHVLRDPTRGGLATTLNEIASQSNVSIIINEDSIPVLPGVQAVCEMLGFDPLYIANEGKVIVIVPEEEATFALEAMKRHPFGKNASQIGVVLEKPQRRVLLKTTIGSTRILDSLSGEILPRIC